MHGSIQPKNIFYFLIIATYFERIETNFTQMLSLLKCSINLVLSLLCLQDIV